MSKRIVALFVAGCPLCEEVRDRVAKLACDACEIVVHDLAAGCESGECLSKAQAYGVTKVPAIAVNGRLAECCAGSVLDDERLRELGIGAA